MLKQTVAVVKKLSACLCGNCSDLESVPGEPQTIDQTDNQSSQSIVTVGFVH